MIGMAGPEYQPTSPQPEAPVQQVPEQAEIPREVEQATGAQVIPHQPDPLQQNGQTVAQPAVPAQDPSGPSITIPAHNEEELNKMAHGKPEDSKTWFGVYWLYRLKKALHSGAKAVFGK